MYKVTVSIVVVEEVPVDSHLVKEKESTRSQSRSSSESRERRARDPARSLRDDADNNRYTLCLHSLFQCT